MRRQSLTVIALGRGRWLPRKLRQYLILGVVGERRAQAQIVLARIVQLVIQLRNPGHVVQMVRSVEAIAAEIQTAVLTESGIVAHWILVQDLLIRRVEADAERINLG